MQQPTRSPATRTLLSVALPDICLVEHITRMTGISAEIIHTALEMGALPGRRLGGTWLIPRPALLQWLSQIRGADDVS